MCKTCYQSLLSSLANYFMYYIFCLFTRLFNQPWLPFPFVNGVGVWSIILSKSVVWASVGALSPPRQGYDSGRQFCGVVATLLGASMHGVAIVHVAAITIATDTGDGGDEAM